MKNIIILISFTIAVTSCFAGGGSGGGPINLTGNDKKSVFSSQEKMKNERPEMALKKRYKRKIKSKNNRKRLYRM